MKARDLTPTSYSEHAQRPFNDDIAEGIEYLEQSFGFRKEDVDR